MDQNRRIEAILLLLENEEAQEASEAFRNIQPENTTQYFLLKAKIEQKFQNWGEAINAFNKVLELEPNHTEAQNSLHLIRNILNFWNPEMFNP
ncbi:hypothetical protein [Maribellus sediminis]|uniref:hypothetical protein n=1 Tax=Maribellus sediminis TaxID=2696285 RepID=UPI00142FC0CA|nr:hypothetical protein [Maribellus sediminis]